MRGKKKEWTKWEDPNPYKLLSAGKHTTANRENTEEEQAKFAPSILQHNHCSCPWHFSSDPSGANFAHFFVCCFYFLSYFDFDYIYEALSGNWNWGLGWTLQWPQAFSSWNCCFSGHQFLTTSHDSFCWLFIYSFIIRCNIQGLIYDYDMMWFFIGNCVWGNGSYHMFFLVMGYTQFIRVKAVCTSFILTSTNNLIYVLLF